MKKLPRLRLSASIGRLGWNETRVMLLDGPLQYKTLRLFHSGFVSDGRTELTLQTLDTSDMYLVLVARAPRDTMTFFSRWRCTGYTETGLRFVMWNPKKIERDGRRRAPR